MYVVAVKDHIMIAHGFRGEVFGPAQRLHGATFIVSAEFSTKTLDDDGIVIDIGLAHTILSEVLEPLRYRNLDDLPEFEGRNTTTEFMAHHIHEGIASRLSGRFVGGLCVRLDESHLAWGSYEAPVGGEAES